MTTRTDRRAKRKRRRELAEVARGDLPRIERLEDEVRTLTRERDEHRAEAAQLRAALQESVERCDIKHDTLASLRLSMRIVEAERNELAADLERAAHDVARWKHEAAQNIAKAKEADKLRKRLDRRQRDAKSAVLNREALGFVKGF